jgi:hypothetical protein
MLVLPGTGAEVAVLGWAHTRSQGELQLWLEAPRDQSQ